MDSGPVLQDRAKSFCPSKNDVEGEGLQLQSCRSGNQQRGFCHRIRQKLCCASGHVGSPIQDMIPKVILRSQAHRTEHTKGVGTYVRSMYCVERDNGPDQWARETCFQTEFKAFVHARTKSLATGNTYRVLFSSPSITGEVLRVSKGKALLDADDQLVG